LGIFGHIGFFLRFLADCKMSESGSNSAFPLPLRSKIFARNRTNIGWKHEIDASGNEKSEM